VYGRERVSFTLNILRFPSFQSALVLPDDLKTQYRDRLTDWLNKHKNQSYMHEHEINHMDRLISYLERVDSPHRDAFDLDKLRNDFKNFYLQYDQRRNKNFLQCFPAMADWFQSI
jgi:hypothetical protein